MFATKYDYAFDFELGKALTMVSASLTPNPRVVTRLTVTRTMCNQFGTLHGGAISTLFDVCTTLAFATARKWEKAGVTRTLSTTCLAPVLPGEEIEIESEVVQIGKKLGMCEREMKTLFDVLAKSVHGDSPHACQDDAGQERQTGSNGYTR